MKDQQQDIYANAISWWGFTVTRGVPSLDMSVLGSCVTVFSFKTYTLYVIISFCSSKKKELTRFFIFYILISESFTATRNIITKLIGHFRIPDVTIMI